MQSSFTAGIGPLSAGSSSLLWHFSSALFVMLPLGVYFLIWLEANYTFPSYYWWAPICAFPVVAFSTILLPILSFRKKDTPYGFAQYQADEFEVRHGIASLFRKN